MAGPNAVVVVRELDGKLRDLDWAPEVDVEVEQVAMSSPTRSCRREDATFRSFGRPAKMASGRDLRPSASRRDNAFGPSLLPRTVQLTGGRRRIRVRRSVERRPGRVTPTQEDFVKNLLAEHGLSPRDLRQGSVGENSVWLTEDHVVRLPSARFPDAYAHEAHAVAMLPASVPRAPIVSHGKYCRMEWILSERVHGKTLSEVWPALDWWERRTACNQLGSIVLDIHRTPLPEGFDNPWLALAFGSEELARGAYHAPPRVFRNLTSAARRIGGIDPGYVTKIERYIEARLSCFSSREPSYLVHADLRFGNLLWENHQIVAVLDFEGSRPAAPDLELDTLVRFFREPEKYVRKEGVRRLEAGQFRGLLDEIARAYPSMFSHPDLVKRLEAYEVMWYLTQLNHFPPDARRDGPWDRLCAIVDGGSSVGETLPCRRG
jgi:aminoglycoside phosphotransferase (APT) family kinase protein